MRQHDRDERKLMKGVVGLLCIVPAFIFCSIGILVVVLGLQQANEALDGMISRVPILQAVIHPLVIFGGLFLALILNAPTVANKKFDRDSGELRITFSTKGRLLNIVVIVSTILCTGTVLRYALGENFMLTAR